MGLLDKAKEKKQEEGAEAPEPEVKEETEATEMEKTDTPLKKKVVKKKKHGKPVGKKPALRKPSPSKKKPMKKRVPKSRREKVAKKPAEPAIEGLPENLEFASVGSRVVALVIDGIFLAVILGIIGIVLLVTLEDAGLYIALILYFILPIGYFLMMESKDGQTIGKGMAHVKIISLDGRPLTTSRVMKSAIAKGLLFPILNILDAVFGVFIQHKGTRQRYTQYETDLIAIAVEKKKVKYGYAADQEDEEGETEGAEGETEGEKGETEGEKGEIKGAESTPDGEIDAPPAADEATSNTQLTP